MDPSPGELLSFGALGAVGGLHCASMCGGFAVAVAGGARSGWSGLGALLLYVLGKALTYAVLGALVATAARSAIHSGVLLAGGEALHETLGPRLQRGLALLAGLGFCVFAAGAFGWAELGPLGDRGARSHRGDRALRRRVAGVLSFLNRQVLALPRRGRGFFLGAVNGLLPCGLTLGALALAGAGSIERAALGMFAFGVGTGPVLVAVGLGGRSWLARGDPRARRLWLRAAGVLALVFALLTFHRAGLWGDEQGGCCPKPPSPEAARAARFEP